MTGILFAFIAAASWAVAAIVARLGLQSVGVINGTFFSLVSSFIVLTIVAIVMDVNAIFAWPLIAIPWFALNGGLNFVLGRLFNYSSLSYIGVARATPILAIAPLVSSGLAIALFGEKVTPLLLLGTLLIMIGLVVIATDKK